MIDKMSISPLILAGGLGTRLRSAVPDFPKVLAPVAGRPFLAFLLDQLIAAGFKQVILCTGYQGNQVRETFGDGYNGLNIQYSHEPEPLGTGGALRYAFSMIKAETVLIMNGDSYIDTNFSNYIDWYLKKHHMAALILTRVPDTSRYGSVQVDKNSLVTHFEEKGQGIGPGWINAGVYLLRKSLLERIPSGKFFLLERKFFPDQVKKGLYAYQCHSKFIDIGTPESYAMAEKYFAGI